MPYANIIDLTERRAHYLEQAYEEGRKEGRGDAVAAFRARESLLCASRARSHARRAFCGALGALALVALLNASPRVAIQGYLLVLLGGALAYSLMHAYRWDHQRELRHKLDG